MNTDRERGKVKSYIAHRAFGFILNDQGNDIFFHASAVRSQEVLAVGDVVEFSTGHDARGRTQARDVEIISRAPKADMAVRYGLSGGNHGTP